jgi:putative component of membrane protein insertase Oxa1/YidC/SpoIIIJ protein YidD
MFLFRYIWIILFIQLPILANPWGKDADLAIKKPAVCTLPTPPQSLLTRFGEAAIRFHQEVISPADGPRSHFIPSSSQYTLDAMRKYGFLVGFTMGCDRLMRENEDPWVYRKTIDLNGYPMKWDPVK